MTTWHKLCIRVYFSFPLCLITPTNHLRVATHSVVNVVSSSHILMHCAARNPDEGTFCFVLLSSHIIFIYLSRRPIINENSRLHVCFEVSLGIFFFLHGRCQRTQTRLMRRMSRIAHRLNYVSCPQCSLYPLYRKSRLVSNVLLTLRFMERVFRINKYIYIFVQFRRVWHYLLLTADDKCHIVQNSQVGDQPLCLVSCIDH